MLNDTFFEHMVKKDPTVADQLKKCGILFVAMLIIGGCFMLLASQYLNMLAAAIAVCTGWIAFLTLRLQGVEYEYIVTNGEMDVDKIQGKSKRKRLVTVDVNSITEFAQYDPQNPMEVGGRTRVLAAKNMKSSETYVALFEHKELGPCILYFTPNEKMVEYIAHAKKGKRVYVPAMGK